MVTDLIDVDDLVEEISKEALSRAKDVLAKRLVANSGGEIESSLLNVAELLQSEVSDRFATWADDQGEIIAPVGTRFAHHSNNVTLFLVEHRPAFRTVSFSSGLFGRGSPKKKANKLTYTLPFPYVYYLPIFHGKQFRGMGMFYRNAPLTSLKDMLYWNNMPNFTNSGHTYCKGNAEADMGISHAQRVESTIRGFWTSSFNTDASTNWVQRQPFKTMAAWEKLSLLDVLKVPWLKYLTAADLCSFYITLLSGDRKTQDVDRNLVQGVCKEIAPRIEGAILSSVKKLRVSALDVRAVRKKVEKSLRQKLEEAAAAKPKKRVKKATKKVTAKKVAKKKVAKKKSAARRSG